MNKHFSFFQLEIALADQGDCHRFPVSPDLAKLYLGQSDDHCKCNSTYRVIYLHLSFSKTVKEADLNMIENYISNAFASFTL